MQRYGVTDLCYDATDPHVDADFCAFLRGLGIRPWLTYSADWGDVDALTLAREMDAAIVRVKSSALSLGMVADIEALWRRGSAYVLAWLNEWRQLRPTRRTVWTTEPLQGGAVSDALAARINSDINLVVVPQLYTFDMTPYPENIVALDIVQTHGRRDIERARVRSYYDSRNMPPAWDGFIWDFNGLP